MAAKKADFDKLEVTCNVCSRKRTVAVWKRLASELESSLSIQRLGTATVYTCPICNSEKR